MSLIFLVKQESSSPGNREQDWMRRCWRLKERRNDERQLQGRRMCQAWCRTNVHCSKWSEVKMRLTIPGVCSSLSSVMTGTEVCLQGPAVWTKLGLNMMRLVKRLFPIKTKQNQEQWKAPFSWRECGFVPFLPQFSGTLLGASMRC